MSTPRRLFLPLAVLAAAYVGLVIAVSLASSETTLAPGEPLRFCGFYLDCHLSAAVEDVEVASLPAGRARYTIRVRFASDARRVTLRLSHAEAELRDARGRKFLPAAAPLDLVLGPGTGVAAELVFDAPADLDQPRLRLRKGGTLERLTEWFLVGDPDSLLHPGVTLALGERALDG